MAKIAAGGMGAVYLARASGELGFSRVVAVKLLHSHLAEDEETVRRFLDEAKVAARVVHPHVVTVHDVVSAEGRVFLVLEYVHGDSLSGLLRAASKRGERVPLAIIAAVVGDMLEGLHAAHEAADDHGVPLGVVHRDISPQNIIVSTKGAAYVTDFGVAKVKDRLRATRTGEMVGKAGYMAPEQLSGGNVGRATDIYGAGIVLWELLTGRRLFDGLEQQIEATVRKKVPTKPSTYRADMPFGLDTLVMSMLAARPEARPRTALDAARELAKLVPRADSAVVADWVIDLATPKLDRLDVAMRETTASEGVSEGTSAGTVAPATSTHTAVSRWRRRAQASLGAAAGALVVAGVLAVVLARGNQPLASPPPSPSAAHSATLADASTAPPSSVASSTPLDVTAPSASSAASPTTPPTIASNRPRRPAKPPRTTPVDCSTPFLVGADGVRRYKTECFGQR